MYVSRLCEISASSLSYIAKAQNERLKHIWHERGSDRESVIEASINFECLIILCLWQELGTIISNTASLFSVS